MDCNKLYQERLLQTEKAAKRFGFHGVLCRLAMKLSGKGTLSCGHRFYYPRLIKEKGHVLFPTYCVACENYSLLSFNDHIEEMVISKDYQEIARLYSADPTMHYCITPSNAYYRSEKA